MRRWAVFTGGGSLVLAVALGFLLGTSNPPTSVVVITIDTLRADHLSSYGYFRTTSPQIDAFAETALVFENVVTTMTTTLPAHTSLFTSTFPLTHGVKGNFEHVEDPVVTGEGLRTLAEMLAERGYETAGFISATPLKNHSGIQTGFATFDQPEGTRRDAVSTTTAVLDWLREPPTKPLFLWVHYFDPHWKYDPPKRHRVFGADDRLTEFLEKLRFPDPSDPEVRRFHDLYDGEIRSADSEIGRLFDRLRELDLFDRSVIVVTSDHGEGLGQHGTVGHEILHNEQLFVPLIVRLPGGRPNGRRGGLASLVDVLPTLATLGVIPASPQFQGSDLLARPAADRELLAERSNRRPKPGWMPGRQYALVGLRWKLVRLIRPDGTVRDELYDMIEDRAEIDDRLDTNPDVAREMGRRLESQVALYESQAFERSGEGVPASVADELRSLGYVQ